MTEPVHVATLGVDRARQFDATQVFALIDGAPHFLGMATAALDFARASDDVAEALLDLGHVAISASIDFEFNPEARETFLALAWLTISNEVDYLREVARWTRYLKLRAQMKLKLRGKNWRLAK